MIQVVYILPNCPGPYRDANIRAEHLGIALLAAVANKHGYHADIVDARMDNLSQEEVLQRVRHADVIGLSLISGDAAMWAETFASKCRKEKPGVHMIAGGYYATLLPELLLENIPVLDAVVCGEGEQTNIELIESFQSGAPLDGIDGIVFWKNGQIQKNRERALLMDLDENPFCIRYAHSIADEGFEVLLEGGRGCLNNCTFCAVKPFFKNMDNVAWRGRSAESLIAELEYIHQAYPNARKIRFVDPDFLGDNRKGRERAFRFCRLLEQRGYTDYKFYMETRVANITQENLELLLTMKKSGFTEIYLGLESGSNEILRTMNKRTTVDDALAAIELLNSIEMDYVYGFMMFTPWSTMEDIKRSADFLSKIGDVQFDRLFYRLNLIPRTPCVKYAGQKGLLRELNSEGYYDYIFEDEQVAALALVWEYLQKYHAAFLMEIWYAYKDVKSWKQSVPSHAKGVLRELSDLSLGLFRDLYSVAREEIITLGERSLRIDGIIAEGRVQVSVLQEKVDSAHRYPRKEMKQT